MRPAAPASAVALSSKASVHPRATVREPSADGKLTTHGCPMKAAVPVSGADQRLSVPPVHALDREVAHAQHFTIRFTMVRSGDGAFVSLGDHRRWRADDL